MRFRGYALNPATCGMIIVLFFGGANATASAVEPVDFSLGRGLYDQPFQLTLSTVASNAVIRFTIDGTLPTESHGQIYTQPFLVGHTTMFRAAAYRAGVPPSVTRTHTYIFPDDVLVQPARPAGFPITTSWSDYGLPSDYGMDSRIVGDPQYQAMMKPALRALPAMSIVMPTDDMFGAANGLYTHASDQNREAACSVELINPDGSGGFQIDAAIQMHGGGSRLRTLKHPFRLRFKSDYGPAKPHAAFFPDSPVTEFDTIDLRADYNNHWTHGFDPNQRARGQLIRDSWYKDVQAAMGAFSSHSRYVHLYINGLYWGIYNPCERPEAAFAASYFGGQKEEFDAFNGSAPDPPIDGDAVARNTLLSLSNLADPTRYAVLEQYLNVRQYIDYLILQWYGANQDWGTTKNWYSFRRRQPGAGFYYMAWDNERTLEGLNDNTLPVSPDDLHAKLAKNSEYRMLFADRVHKHLFNEGALTTNAVIQSWMKRAAQLDTAIVAESARWGDSMPKEALSPLPYPSYHAGTPFNRNEDWLGEQGRLLTNYFPYRSSVFLKQLRAAGLYPSLAAPEYNQHGGWVPIGFHLVMNNPGSGTVFYTTNGLDPRSPVSAAVSADARPLDALGVELTSSVVVKARVRDAAGNWSALTEAEFEVAERGLPVRITEIMNRPAGGEAYEFIELQNVGHLPVDLSGASCTGVEFVFPYGTILAPGAFVLLIRDTDPATFVARYPGVQVFGYYKKHLAEEGERLALLDRSGQTITSVTYANTDPWPVLAEAAGRSLELIDPNGDQSDPANWQASAALGGSPGQVNPMPTASVVRLNEVMAANIAAVSNSWGFSDWVELYNGGDETVDLAGWILGRDGGRPRLIFPDKTTLAAGGYLVVWCDGLTGFPGLHAGFSLERQGGTLALYDRSGNRVDVLSYGPQLADYSLGRGTSTAGPWQLSQPTPGADNQPVAIPLATNLVLNEWMANPEPGSADWVELFNSSDVAPAMLTGLYLETSHALFQIKSPAFLSPRGYVRLWADEKPGGNHLDFKLPSAGGQINLYDSTGRLLDHIVYGAQAEGSSEGRLPDGAATIVQFPDTPTPGSSNTLTAPLVLSVRPEGRTAGGFQFQISGQAGSEYLIVFSTDLVHWTPLGNAAAGGKLTEYTDALPTNSMARFYRAMVQPKP